jgi:hypothetical protein
MLVFIDDSGDAGFKIEKGSSRFFVISAVIFNDNLEAEKVAVAIKELKRKLKFPDGVEFKFNKSRRHTREEFFEAISDFKFSVRSLVVDKKIIRSAELKNNRNSFYSYAIKMLLKYNNHSIVNASIKIDGSGDRVFRKTFVAYLRKEINSDSAKIIEHCKLVDSKKNVLIQMADMIAGSIRRSYDVSKSDAKIYKSIIANHIIDEWQFK